jgi:plasmid maintenance system killer protein
MGGDHNPAGYRVKRFQAIDVSWADRKLAKAAESDASGVRRFGAEQWAVLKRRLAVLRTAPTLADVRGTPGRLHALTSDRSGQYSMDLRGPSRLVFEPATESASPRTNADGVDEQAVTAVRMLEVVDTHE